MAIKTYKPVTNGRRNMTSLTYEEITTNKPEKSLVAKVSKNGGRNNQGVITTRHHGGGHKRKYRIIDFKRNKDDIVGTVATIEYDPNRSANIALINYADGEKRYILAPKGLEVGSKIVSGENADIKVGNALPMGNMPEGTVIHNIEMQPGKGGQIARSAGVVVGNEDHGLVNYGKAGRMRWKGVKPTVRGSVMNPNDHPHGGGEGRTSIGRKAPMTPWGKKAMGVKTRKNKKASTKLIVRRRNSK